MPTEKIIGYSLLSVGILLMIFSTFQIISVFTGKAKPIPLFSMEAPTKSTNTNTKSQKQTPAELAQKIQTDPFSLLQQSGGLPVPELIDPAVLGRMLNLIVYYLIMQFLLGLGFKLSSLGVGLVRPLKINVDKNRLETLIKSDQTNP